VEVKVQASLHLDTSFTLRPPLPMTVSDISNFQKNSDLLNNANKVSVMSHWNQNILNSPLLQEVAIHQCFLETLSDVYS